MAQSELFRVGGLALAIGAVAFIVHIVARSLITAGVEPATVYPGSPWALVNALGVLGAVLVLWGLPAAYAAIAPRAGASALAGVLLIALAWTFFGVFLSLFSLLVAPWLADKAPQLVAANAPLPAGFQIAFAVGLLAELAGTVCLALPFLRGAVEPRWVGWLLPVSALWTIAGSLIAPAGPAANLAVNLLSNLGPVLLMIALGDLGWRSLLQAGR